MKKVLYGICGIGLGHMYRQLPILEELVQQHKVMVFAYGESLTFCRHTFKNTPHVQIAEVAVPYLVGGTDGIDFSASATHPHNQQNFTRINAQAFAKAKAFFGTPDIVFSDYEPNAAQYATMHSAPLYTIDQQSKYLVGTFPEETNGYTYKDEVERLKLFFPHVTGRIVTSFFDFNIKEPYASHTQVVQPTLRKSLQQHTQRTTEKNKIIVYISAQDGYAQNITEVTSLLHTHEEYTFHLYAKGEAARTHHNVHIYPHAHTSFDKNLLSCDGLISTAGHSLLSEAVALNIPTLALPLAIYEQQYNAHIMNQAIGLPTEEALTPSLLQHFLSAAQDGCLQPIQQPSLRLKEYVLSLIAE